MDAEGSRYGRKGLTVAADGVELAHRDTLGRIEVPLARKANAAIVREENLAVQLVRDSFPRPSASSGTDAEKLHDGIDGRAWFYPELPNGWDSAPSSKPQWYSVDFGKNVTLGRAELAFFDDGKAFAAPRGVAVEVWRSGRWRKVGAAAKVVANGVTQISWPALESERIRVTMTPSNGRAIRLAELKAFSR